MQLKQPEEEDQKLEAGCELYCGRCFCFQFLSF